MLYNTWLCRDGVSWRI